MKPGKQQTVIWHVNDFKFRHADAKVNGEFGDWFRKHYGSDNLGHVKVVRGKIHEHLGMIVDFTQEGALKIDMKYYTKVMLE